MTAARWRLYFAFGLFAVWVSWLGYQALSRDRSPVISRSQLLVSTIDVIGIVQADVDGRPAPMVDVEEIHWPKDGGGLKKGDRIQVTNLPETTGFKIIGPYILPLVTGEARGEYKIAGIPNSPGFETYPSRFFIYPLTDGTRKQLEAIGKRQ
jgi:hypothetical protein